MANVVILGAGFAGNTAALYARHHLGKGHKVTVVNRLETFGYVPSWVWVSIGTMAPERTTFPLAKTYRPRGIEFIHGRATEIHPDEGDQYVVVEKHGGGSVQVPYDYLLIATGPKLDFEATPGLGPENGHTFSICSLPHAVQTRDRYFELLDEMEAGRKVRIVVGTGHGGATCQGAAFEFLYNMHKDLIRRGLREQASLHWFSNEPEPGDFGIRGVQTTSKGKTLNSRQFIEGIFRDAGITWEVQRAVHKVEHGRIHWENADGETGTTEFDFAMLIPKFSGQPMKYVGRNGEDVSEKVVNKGGVVLVDGEYGLDYETLSHRPEAWPSAYQNQAYQNIFSAGIAFAPPGPISRPHITKNGTAIAAAPPRTGMVSGVIGRIAALNIVGLIKSGKLTHHERMSHMVAACIASMGSSLWDGLAAVIIIYPVVPDTNAYPGEGGRDNFVTHMELGLSGAWMKLVIHYTMIWKMHGRIGWRIIPE